MNMMWLLRMKRLVQHPPSPQRLKLIAIVVLACFVLFGYERLFGWPAWLTVNSARR